MPVRKANKELRRKVKLIWMDGETDLNKLSVIADTKVNNVRRWVKDWEAERQVLAMSSEYKQALGLSNETLEQNEAHKRRVSSILEDEAEKIDTISECRELLQTLLTKLKKFDDFDAEEAVTCANLIKAFIHTNKAERELQKNYLNILKEWQEQHKISVISDALSTSVKTTATLQARSAFVSAVSHNPEKANQTLLDRTAGVDEEDFFGGGN